MKGAIALSKLRGLLGKGRNSGSVQIRGEYVCPLGQNAANAHA